jgi:hypothetical protein
MTHRRRKLKLPHLRRRHLLSVKQQVDSPGSHHAITTDQLAANFDAVDVASQVYVGIGDFELLT